MFVSGCDPAGHLFLVNDFHGVSWSVLRSAVKYCPHLFQKNREDNSRRVLENQVGKDLEGSSSPAVLA